MKVIRQESDSKGSRRRRRRRFKVWMWEVAEVKGVCPRTVGRDVRAGKVDLKDLGSVVGYLSNPPRERDEVRRDFCYSYEDVAKARGTSVNAVKRYFSRRGITPADLRRVAEYIVIKKRLV